MRTLITGATGLLGSALCAHLTAQGQPVRVLSRSPERASRKLPEAEAAFAWPSPSEPIPPEALEGVDAVVHLAGETVDGRWTAKKKAAILESRREGTRSLVASIAALPESERPTVLLSASAVGFYGDRGDEELTEESATGSGFLAEVCQVWEGEAQAAEALGLRVVRTRMGLVLSRDGGVLPALLPTARWGLSGPMGGGRQWWSWVHIDDAIRILARCLGDPSIAGAINVTSPGAVTQGDFVRSIGRQLGRPAFLGAPAWVLRTALGEFSAEILTSKCVRPARALAAGYEFEFTELDAALDALLGG